MNDEEKLPLFSRLNDSIDASFQRVGEFIADAAEDKPGIGDDIVRGGIRGLSFIGNLPVIKQLGQLEDKLVDTVGNLAERQSVVDPRSFRYTTRVATMFIPYAGAAKVLSKGKVASKFSKLKSRMFNSLDDTRYFTRDELLEMGIGSPQMSKFADDLDVSKLSLKQLENELNIRSVDLGYSLKDVGTTPRGNQMGIPKDITTLYLNHAQAYNKAQKLQGGNLLKFPNLVYNKVWYRPKPKKLAKNDNYVYLEDWLDRKMRTKLGVSARSLRIWKQTSKDVAKGTFYNEKLKQLRALNRIEDLNGLPRTRLRDVELDHKNALRSVEDITRGLGEENTQFIFDILEEFDLFTGDHARNLILRDKKIHRGLWPQMKAALKKLNLKTIDDFQNTKYPELEYLKYLAGDIKNPKYSDDTPLREYIDTIKFIEEQAADKELALLIKRIKAMRAAKSFPNVKTTDSVSQALIRIFGGYEGLEVFIQRLKNNYPVNLQTDMIRGELEQLGSFGPIDEDVLRRIIEEI